MQLDGHSDADVLLHAVTDAVLGAASLGDIGELFPNSEEVNRGRNSTEMLQIAMDRFRDSNFKLLNVDCIILPKSRNSPNTSKASRNRLRVLWTWNPCW